MAKYYSKITLKRMSELLGLGLQVSVFVSLLVTFVLIDGVLLFLS